jgi:hypothetical protein
VSVPPAAYWTLATTSALVLLAGASAMADVTIERTPPGARIPTLRIDDKIVHRVSNNRSGQALLDIRGLTPGQEGRRRVVIANAGPRPFRRVTITQDHLVPGGFSDALQLQVYDAITRRCLYPRPPAHLRVPRVRTEPDRCFRWMPFDARRDLHFLPIPGKDGSNTWQRGEMHAIDVRYRLAPTSPNSDQGRRSSFRLRWYTHG